MNSYALRYRRQKWQDVSFLSLGCPPQRTLFGDRTAVAAGLDGSPPITPAPTPPDGQDPEIMPSLAVE
jgi:hypothetical protein